MRSQLLKVFDISWVWWAWEQMWLASNDWFGDLLILALKWGLAKGKLRFLGQYKKRNSDDVAVRLSRRLKKKQERIKPMTDINRYQWYQITQLCFAALFYLVSQWCRCFPWRESSCWPSSWVNSMPLMACAWRLSWVDSIESERSLRKYGTLIWFKKTLAFVNIYAFA